MKKLVKVVIASTVVLGLLASCATTKGAEGSSESVKTEKAISFIVDNAKIK